MTTRRDISFLEAMKSLLVFDGAMGSLLYERGVFVTQNFEQLNVTRPDIVRRDPRGLRRRGRAGHRDQHLRRQPLPPRAARAGRRGARLQPRRRPPRARGRRRARTSRARWGRPGSCPGVADGVRTLDARCRRRSPSRRRRSSRAAPTCSCSRRSATSTSSRSPSRPRARRAPGLPILASVTFDASGTVADGTGTGEGRRARCATWAST